MKQSIEADNFEATHHEGEKSIQDLDGDLDIRAKRAHLDNAQVLSPAENRRVLLRIDKVLMPLMFISYGLQYMDKALLSSAAQFGIVDDLDLYDVAIIGGQPVVDLKKFSYATLIFCWGFVLGCQLRTLVKECTPSTQTV
ncbi:hypothetical protein BKA61DRAFT_671641 [Leptodontidium sp. MPI-SDFR-AT-0119]|nr:hypothetical protein BKA61DRAFT_671641 [Leptodontidium sp. MPI-SDFR-AT-0119]